MIGRIVAVIFAVLLAVALFLQLIGGGGGGGEPSATPPSKDTSAAGIAAFASLAEQQGVSIERGREPLIDTIADHDEDTTVMIFNRFLNDEEIDELEFRAEYSRVITVGYFTSNDLGFGAESAPISDPAAVTRPDLLGGARSVSADLGWGRQDWDDAEILAGTPDAVVVARRQFEDGEILGVSSDSLVRNATLADLDNAAAALALVGDSKRLVIYDSVLGGDDSSTGFAAIPWRGRWFLGGLSAAMAVLVFAIGRRVGPPELPHRELAPPRSAYADSLGRVVARSRRRRRIGGRKTPPPPSVSSGPPGSDQPTVLPRPSGPSKGSPLP
jgi:hypothetical protein